MTLRQLILSKYLHHQNVYETIGHSTWVYVKIFVLYLVLILAITVLFVFVRQLYPLVRVSYIWAILLLGIYLKCVWDLFDEYLDALLITDRWLARVTRDNPFRHRVDTIERWSLETVSDYQETFIDSIVKKGHLKISLIEDDYYFRDIWLPAVASTMILDYKDMMLAKSHSPAAADEEPDHDKYKLLVEALWEVVTDYVSRKDKWVDTYY